MQNGTGDFRVGTKMKSQGRTISEGDFTAMVNLSWETGALHSDREFMKTTQFGERILGGPCIIPFVAGLSSQPLHTAWDKAGIQPVALVSIENVRFTAPLHPGDTLWVETEVTERRPTSKPGRYLTFLKDIAYKQEGQVIMEMERIVLLDDAP